jgi:hypothetical protein
MKRPKLVASSVKRCRRENASATEATLRDVGSGPGRRLDAGASTHAPLFIWGRKPRFAETYVPLFGVSFIALDFTYGVTVTK